MKFILKKLGEFQCKRRIKGVMITRSEQYEWQNRTESSVCLREN